MAFPHPSIIVAECAVESGDRQDPPDINAPTGIFRADVRQIPHEIVSHTLRRGGSSEKWSVEPSRVVRVREFPIPPARPPSNDTDFTTARTCGAQW
ncbi:hypothetical protein [Streptomyces spiramenti]|uniref:Uncharacterized protein n=1 Tax=Streptomyces spiramenti TaxID=2720606 RepID=A0ABX1AMW0_9ACTN|nr:hypothetical protein [Streptomyces spiramenti]NJP67411.1 hypothetical protein [Streptomyces spiramenti]